MRVYTVYNMYFIVQNQLLIKMRERERPLRGQSWGQARFRELHGRCVVSVLFVHVVIQRERGRGMGVHILCVYDIYPINPICFLFTSSRNALLFFLVSIVQQAVSRNTPKYSLALVGKTDSKISKAILCWNSWIIIFSWTANFFTSSIHYKLTQ